MRVLFLIPCLALAVADDAAPIDVASIVAEIQVLQKSVTAISTQFEHLATKSDVEGAKVEVPKIDLSNLASKSDLSVIASKSDLSGLALKTDLPTVDLSSLPSKADLKTDFSSLPSKADLKADLSSLPSKDELKAGLSGLASKADLSGLAMKTDLAALAGSKEPAVMPDLTDLAKKSDLSGLATSADVLAVPSKIDLSKCDLSGHTFLSKEDVAKAVSGLASKEDLKTLQKDVEGIKSSISELTATLAAKIEADAKRAESSMKMPSFDMAHYWKQTRVASSQGFDHLQSVTSQGLESAAQMAADAQTRLGPMANEHGEKIAKHAQTLGQFVAQEARARYQQYVNVVTDGVATQVPKLIPEEHADKVVKAIVGVTLFIAGLIFLRITLGFLKFFLRKLCCCCCRGSKRPTSAKSSKKNKKNKEN